MQSTIQVSKFGLKTRRAAIVKTNLIRQYWWDCLPIHSSNMGKFDTELGHVHLFSFGCQFTDCTNTYFNAALCLVFESATRVSIQITETVKTTASPNTLVCCENTHVNYSYSQFEKKNSMILRVSYLTYAVGENMNMASK